MRSERLRVGLLVVGTVTTTMLLVTWRRRKRRPQTALESKVTVILCTSPVKTNPSTALIEETVGSMRHYASALEGCPCIVICDGYKIRAENRYRSGQVTVDGGEKYEEYLRRLRKLNFGRIVRCSERLGFGFALKKALTYVRTPFVCVVQHDRNFVRRVDIESLVAELEKHQSWLKYIGLPTTTTLHYPRFVLSKYAFRIEPKRLSPSITVVPLLQWYDSTHICATQHYRDFVYRGDLVKKGGFVEDKLGQFQLADIRKNGLDAHSVYGTYVLDDGVDRPIVAHLDGHDILAYRKFKFATNVNPSS